MKAPSCIGYYEPGDDQCDGRHYDPHSKGERSAPCRIRAQCREIKKYKLRVKNRVNEILTGQPISEIDRFIEHVKEGGEIDSFIHGRILKAVISDRQKLNSQECWSLYRHFENQLADRFGESRLANRLCHEKQNLVVFIQGTLFPIDRTNRRIAYVVWYCKTNSGYDTLISKIYFRSRSKSLNIAVPVELDVLSEVFSDTTMKKLKATPIEQGVLRTSFRQLSYEGVGLTVSCLKRLVDRNIIDVPRRIR